MEPGLEKPCKKPLELCKKWWRLIELKRKNEPEEQWRELSEMPPYFTLDLLDILANGIGGPSVAPPGNPGLAGGHAPNFSQKAENSEIQIIVKFERWRSRTMTGPFTKC